MPANAVTAFEVRSSLLWFREIGRTSPDGFDAASERDEPIYETRLARPGDVFERASDHLVHVDGRGRSSRASLVEAQDYACDRSLRELERMARSGIVRAAAPSGASAPIPESRFPANSERVLRREASPEFVRMLDAAKDAFRRAEEIGCGVHCVDVGARREIGFCISDLETSLPRVAFNYDPVSRAGFLHFADIAQAIRAEAALAAAGQNPVRSASDIRVVAGMADVLAAATRELDPAPGGEEPETAFARALAL